MEAIVPSRMRIRPAVGLSLVLGLSMTMPVRPQERPDFDLSGPWRCSGNCGAAVGTSITIRQTGEDLQLTTDKGETIRGSASLRTRQPSSLKCLLKPPPAECAKMTTTYERQVALGIGPGGWNCQLIPSDIRSRSDTAPPFKAVTFTLQSVEIFKEKCAFPGSIWTAGNEAALPETAAAITCDAELLEAGGRFRSAGLSVVVRPARDTAYGWAAEISEGGSTRREKDVGVGAVFPNDPVGRHVRELSRKLAPAVKWDTVHHIREISVGFESMLKQSRGIAIYEIRDAKSQPMARLLTIDEIKLGRCAGGR